MTVRTLALALLVTLGALARSAGPAAADPDADRAKAASSFKQGQAYFARGDFDRAIAEYQVAFELSKEPSLIFNIALCHNRANRPQQALQLYKQYLELAPDGDVADEARDEVARLTPVVEKLEADAAAAQRDREARRLQNRPPPPSRVPLYIMISGAAVLATGATFHVLAWRTRDGLESAPDPDTYFSDRDSFKTQRAVAIGATAVGAATILTGLVLRFTVFRGGGGPEVSAALAPGGGTVMLGWSR
jgi:tetratricopeptide (TPR) repeat protein